MSKIVLVTGGFDPIHSGHISYFKNAKELYPNTPLCVGLNSDDWLIRKKGKYFPFLRINQSSEFNPTHNGVCGYNSFAFLKYEI